MDAIGFELTDRDETLDFGDRDACGRSHYRIEVSRRLSINEIAPLIALPRLDEREVGDKSSFEHIHAPVKIAGLLAIGYKRAIPGGCVEARNARPACAHA